MPQRCALSSLKSPGSGVAFHELSQFSFWNRKLGDATIQTNHEFRKYPDDGYIRILQPRKMDGKFSIELSEIR
jgi:hypothetical protein